MLKKLIGDKAFYKMVMAVAVPIMVQNGITNFVGLLIQIVLEFHIYLRDVEPFN